MHEAKLHEMWILIIYTQGVIAKTNFLMLNDYDNYQTT